VEIGGSLKLSKGKNMKKKSAEGQLDLFKVETKSEKKSEPVEKPIICYVTKLAKGSPECKKCKAYASTDSKTNLTYCNMKKVTEDMINNG